MTVKSIGPQGVHGYAEYLDGKTIAPALGDYYLGRDGEPVESPGRWLAHPATLSSLGIDPGAPVAREDLIALMEGRRPGSEEYLRRAGPTGTRNAGVDLVLSAPKSVSVAWALADVDQRGEIERLHQAAVVRTVEHLRGSVPLTVERPGGGPPVPALARDVLAVGFQHSTARGLVGRAPDPQLHTHVIVTSVVRRDGRVAAVRDRMVYRAAREGGAFYRAALAEGLVRAGYELHVGTGNKGRYFELAGVRAEAVDAFSGRGKEIERAVRVFEAREGRRPIENELQHLKLASRQTKELHTTRELSDAWQQTARKHQQPTVSPSLRPERFSDSDPGWSGRVERELTRERATFGNREARATALEQAAGRLRPDTALTRIDELVDAGQLIRLENGTLTTRTLREMERSILASTRDMTHPASDRSPVPERLMSAAIAQASEHVGVRLSREQEHAVRVLCGPSRLVALEGQAGTGKSAVIDAAARLERMTGRRPVGVALAGATAQRLGQESPALVGRTTTIASLLARHDQTGAEVDRQTTVIVDEAGMVDTPTLAKLVAATRDAGARLIAVGDGKQLPAIGPGGMFDKLTQHAPKAALVTVHRTKDREEQKAWRALREGKPERAMAHYLARDQLHLADTRDQALQAAATRYDELSNRYGVLEVALMSDGPTSEIDRLNARAQNLRLERGELGHDHIQIPGEDAPHYPLRTGDLVCWRQIQPIPGQARIENGTRGIITHTNAREDRVQVELVGSGRTVTVTGPSELPALRLGYAQHVVRQQGATVDRAVAVTGGWQTSRENAYVQASRARHGIDWHVPRDQLSQDGTDPERIQKLADRIRQTQAKTPSIDHQHDGQPREPAPTPIELSVPLEILPLPERLPELPEQQSIEI